MNHQKIWLRILLHATDQALYNVQVKIGGEWYVAQQEGFRHPSGRLITEGGENYDIEEIRCQKQEKTVTIKAAGEVYQ